MGLPIASADFRGPHGQVAVSLAAVVWFSQASFVSSCSCRRSLVQEMPSYFLSHAGRREPPRIFGVWPDFLRERGKIVSRRWAATLSIQDEQRANLVAARGDPG